MAEATHAEVHRHPAPTGFIRKYIFSIDHKVIGIQYILLALPDDEFRALTALPQDKFQAKKEELLSKYQLPQY